MKRGTTGSLGMILVLVATTFLSFGSAAAQRFGGRGGDSMVPPERVLERLGITEGQLEQIMQLREGARTELGLLQEDLKEYRQQAKTLLESGAPEIAQEVGNNVIWAHSVGEEIRALRQSLREDFESILTADQLTALEEFNSNRHRRRGSRQGFRGSRDGSPDGEF